MQIKTTKRYTVHSLEWLKIKRLTVTSADKDVQQLEFSKQECKMGHPSGEVQWFLTKVNRHSPCSPALPLLGIYPGETEHTPT